MEVIKVKDVSKFFILKHEKKRRVYDYLFNKRKESETFYALTKVSLTLKKGECLGVIGRNGSGKTTLLKIIAGIMKASSGSVSVKEKMVPFIELGVGIQPDFTGRENIYLYGSLLEISRKEIDTQLNEIIKIAELEKFIDLPIKVYSSGMQVRLAFATAVLCNPDILLIDEIFSVGDLSFQRKSMMKIKEFKQQGKSIIFVSHSLNDILSICDKCILLDQGKIIKSGNTEEVVNYYSNFILKNDKKRLIENIKRMHTQILDFELKKSETKESELIAQIDETITRLEQENSYFVRELKSLIYTLLKEKEREIDEIEIQKDKILENLNLPNQKQNTKDELKSKLILMENQLEKQEKEKSHIITEIGDIIYMQLANKSFDKFSLFRELRTLVDMTLEKDNSNALKIIKNIKSIIHKEMKRDLCEDMRQRCIEEIKWAIHKEIKIAVDVTKKIRLIREYKNMVLN